MKSITLNEYIRFFKNLNLKDKVSLLKELTQALNEEVVETSTLVIDENSIDPVDELFGSWKEDEYLTEALIINRSVSDRVIDLN